MTLEATHEGARDVQIAVTLRQARRAHAPDAWSAGIMLTLEAGEQLCELASAAGHFSARHPVKGPDPAEPPDRCPLCPSA